MLTANSRHTVGKSAARPSCELTQSDRNAKDRQSPELSQNSAAEKATATSPAVLSALYVGRILHHRYRPKEHRFQYGLFMPLVDLDEIETLFGKGWFCSKSWWSPVRFRRADYFGDSSRPLADCIREKVMIYAGLEVKGPIRMLAHLRYFGFTFNPVVFYYCYSSEGDELQAVVADVTNTPWGERHAYVIPVENGSVSDYCCQKQFHVSPFMPMNQTYRWSVTSPDQQLNVMIENRDDEEPVFVAKLDLQRQPFTKLRLAGLLAKFPWITVKVLVAIYWQAFRLWFKGIPFVQHPKKQS